MADTGHARDYAAVAEKYAREAVKDRKGKRHCSWVRLAAKRHLEDRKRAKKGWDYEWSDWHANDVCDFIEKLPHVEGSWDSPTITLEPPQIFLLAVIFGWRRVSDGMRRFSRVYIEMARKGAKSTLTAGVALYCLCCEDEVGPQIIIGATTGEQAKKVFTPAQQMVKKTAELREAFGVEAWARSITCQETAGYIQTINAKSSTQDGWNPHVGILDELHAHKDRGLHDVIRSAFGARRQPLMWVITTAGYIIDGVCYEQRTLVTKVLQGVVEADHYFGIIFTLDEGDSEFDEDSWIKANPLLGVTPRTEEMRGFAQEAKASPDSLYEFRTKRLNLWTTAKGAWVNIERWKKCSGPVNLEEMRELPCWGGLDLASTSDITAFLLAWLDGDVVRCVGRYYVPEEIVTPRTEKANIPYRRWVDHGLMIATPGNVTDYSWIEKDVKLVLEEYDIRAIAYDPWNASHLANRLTEEGAPLVEFRQGFKSYHPAMKYLEELYQSGRLAHGGDPVLTWMASNVVARTDANNNLAPSKKDSQEKIDGFAALCMAIGLMREEVNVDTTSVYETRGVLTFGRVGE